MNKHCYWLLGVLVLSLGCSNESGTETSGENKKKASGPKLNFHRPRQLSVAAKRYRDIHEQLVGQGGMPSPVKIDYVEVIHGEGPSAHSHYYTAEHYKRRKETGHKDEDDHGDDMKEEVKEKVLVVDFRTELEDLTGWLPDIAARASLNESDWERVRSIADDVKRIMKPLADKTDDQFRDAWKEHQDRLGELIGELEQLAAKSDKAKK